MKNFTQEKWKQQLAMKDWEKIGETEDVNEMAQHFNEQVIEALDECAPIKEMKVRQMYRDGLTDRTKAMIKERDRMRKEIKRSPNETKVLHEKYKKMRNRVTQQIRKDTIAMEKEWKKPETKTKYGRWLRT